MQSKDICLLASRTAKGGTGMVALAGQFLNLVLEDLKLNRNLKVNRVTQTVTVGGGTFGPFNLEADYLRTYDMSYPITTPGGETQFLTPITMEQFDAEPKASAAADFPYEFATDLSTQAQTASGTAGQFYVYPMASGSITVTHRYMKNQPDIVTPETSAAVPWFPFTLYLTRQTAALLMGVTGDSRETSYLKENEEMLRPHLIMEGDEQQTVRAVRLDPRRFRTNGSVRPTKLDPY